MSFWFTQQPRIPLDVPESPEHLPSTDESVGLASPVGGLLTHFQSWEQQRLSLSQTLERARWFVLWHHPSGDSTPFGFAVLEECPRAIYGYSLWARRNGRIQRIATAINKDMLDEYLQAERCELTSQAREVRSFLQTVAQQLTLRR